MRVEYAYQRLDATLIFSSDFMGRSVTQFGGCARAVPLLLVVESAITSPLQKRLSELADY
jgi:hypothetical protein